MTTEELIQELLKESGIGKDAMMVRVNSDLLRRAAADLTGLGEERDLWKARAMAMFWKLPGDMTIGELQDDARRALEFVRKHPNG